MGPQFRALNWWLCFRGVDRPPWQGSSQATVVLTQRLGLLSKQGTTAWARDAGGETDLEGVLVTHAPGTCSGLQRTVSAVG